MVSKMKNFNILGAHWKILLLVGAGGGGGSQKNKGVAWTVYQFKGGLGKKEAWGRGWYPNAHYVIYIYIVCDHEKTQAMQFAEASF